MAMIDLSSSPDTALTEADLQKLGEKTFYDPSEPRDDSGRWTDDGGHTSKPNVPKNTEWTSEDGHTLAHNHVPKDIIDRVESLSAVADLRAHPHDAADITAGLAGSRKAELLNLVDKLGAEGRHTILLHRGDEKKGIPTVWLLGWSKDEGTDIHDHAGSGVGITVLRGKVIDRAYTPVEGAAHHLRDLSTRAQGVQIAQHERILREGSTMELPHHYLHDVFGASSNKHSDVTVHAYWPPLRSMGYYKFRTHNRIAWDGDWVEGRPHTDDERRHSHGEQGDHNYATGAQTGHPFQGNQWTKDGLYIGKKTQFRATIPEHLAFSFQDQVGQYPKKGKPGLGYFRGDIGARGYVDTLLYRDDKGKILGILNHYPQDITQKITSGVMRGMNAIVERKGNVNVLVDPAHQKKGIGEQLMREAGRRWNVSLAQQQFTPSGAKLANKIANKDVDAASRPSHVKKHAEEQIDFKQIEGKLNEMEARSLKQLHGCMLEVKDALLARVRSQKKQLTKLAKSLDLPRKSALREAVQAMLQRAWDAGNTDVGKERRALKRTVASYDQAVEGVWRTINGTHLFIRIGQKIADAIKDHLGGSTQAEQAGKIEEETRTLQRQFPNWTMRSIIDHLQHDKRFEPKLVHEIVTAMYVSVGDPKFYLTPQDVHMDGPVKPAPKKARKCSQCGNPAITMLGSSLFCNDCAEQADARKFDEETDAITRVVYELALQFPNYGKDSILSIMLNKKEFDPGLVRQVIDSMWESGKLRANYEAVGHPFHGNQWRHPLAGMGILRKNMPQIAAHDLPEFYEFAKQKGVSVTDEVVDAKVLHPSQNEYNPKAVEMLRGQKILDKPVLISRDNVVLDGHHRWLHRLGNGEKLSARRVDLPAVEAIALMHAFPKTYSSLLTEAISEKEHFDVREFAGSSPASVTPRSALQWLRAKSFYVTDLISNALTEQVRGALLNGIKTGRPVEQIVNDIATLLLPYTGDENVIEDDEQLTPYRLETIVRTNTTDAYNHGRLTDMMDKDVRPFLTAIRFSAILDERTTPVCEFLHDFLFKPGDSDIDELIPPLHYNCRSILVPVVVGMQVDKGDFISPSEVGKAKGLADARFLTNSTLWKNYVDREDEVDEANYVVLTDLSEEERAFAERNQCVWRMVNGVRSCVAE